MCSLFLSLSCLHVHCPPFCYPLSFFLLFITVSFFIADSGSHSPPPGTVPFRNNWSCWGVDVLCHTTSFPSMKKIIYRVRRVAFFWQSILSPRRGLTSHADNPRDATSHNGNRFVSQPLRIILTPAQISILYRTEGSRPQSTYTRICMCEFTFVMRSLMKNVYRNV